jgi:hypothetical protein
MIIMKHIKRFNESINEDDIISKINSFYKKGNSIPINFLVKDLNFRIGNFAMTINDENVLYNVNKGYQILFDKSEDGTITQNEESELTDIFKDRLNELRSVEIYRLYLRYKNNKEYFNFINFVENNFINND